MLRKSFGLCVVLALFGGSSAQAQFPGGLELEPYVGAYIPLTSAIDQEILGFQIKGKQKEGFALGARLTYWLPAVPLGIEGNFRYAFSDAEVDADGEVSDTSAYVYAADARLAFKVLPAPIGLHLNGGIALIGRGGDAYDDINTTAGKTNVGGVVGLGIRFGLPGMFAIRADADTYLYSAQITVDDPDVGGEFQFDSAFQADLVLSAGLIIGFL
jgi:hypothetical protein